MTGSKPSMPTVRYLRWAIQTYLLLTALLPTRTSAQEAWSNVVAGDARTIAVGKQAWYAATAEYLLRSTDRGGTWDTLLIPVPFMGDFTSVVVVPDSETVIFSAEPGVYHSTDHGTTWTWAGPPAVGVYSLAVDSAGRVFASGSMGVLRSTDRGATWDTVHTNPGPFTDGLLVTPNGTVLSSSIIGGLLASADGGVQWDSLRGLATPPGLVTSMAVSPTTGTLVVSVVHIHNAGAGAPLYRSTDGGETWTAVDSGFVLLDALASDEQGRFYVGGDDVRRSTDDGVTWQPLGEDYPPGGHVTAIIPVGSAIFVCDRNHGIFELRSTTTSAPDAPVVPSHSILLHNYPNPFNASTIIRFRVDVRDHERSGAGDRWTDEAWHVRLAVYDLLGREVAMLFNGPVVPGDHTVSWDASSVPSGLYLTALEVGGDGTSVPVVRRVKSMIVLK